MDKPRFSFEFFPAKTDQGLENLKTTRQRLNELGPEFFSVTYGAGGSTRDNTRNIVLQMKEEGLDVAPHLSFGVGDSEESMLELINDYRNAGIDRIVALRGDAPSGSSGSSQMVYANELVKFIRKHTGDHFHLEVASYPEIHPESIDYNSDIFYLKKKFEAGADSSITQYFFNSDAYFYYLEDCRKAGIDQPIYPGIMPITNFENLKRFSANCGADIPRWITRKVESYGDDQDSITAFGIDIITDLSQRLLDGGAPGIHFYTMNREEPTSTILKALR